MYMYSALRIYMQITKASVCGKVSDFVTQKVYSHNHICVVKHLATQQSNYVRVDKTLQRTLYVTLHP